MKTILCINGSDTNGHAGIQADIRTVKDLGAYALTIITAVTVSTGERAPKVHAHQILSASLVADQLQTIDPGITVDAVKVGLVNDSDAIREVQRFVGGHPCVVCSPVILSSWGDAMMTDEAVQAYRQMLFPECRMLIIKSVDAEIILHRSICTDADMLAAARELHDMGPDWVLLRGATYTEGRINALLSCSPAVVDAPPPSFFSSVNIEGWQRHGVGGTLSTAVATRMALGDNATHAVSNAHNYLHSQIVYSSARTVFALQPHRLYDRFISLIADHYTTSHDVAYYAAALCISPRYLAQITTKICGRSPKVVIDDYLLKESLQLLATTSLTVQEISNQLGFSSQVNFARFFKARHDMTPTDYRLRRVKNG